jgi:hypothetical protein
MRSGQIGALCAVTSSLLENRRISYSDEELMETFGKQVACLTDPSTAEFVKRQQTPTLPRA